MQESGERCAAAFLENREPGDHRVCRKVFCENPGKNFWRNSFGKNLVKRIIVGVEIFADGISLKVKEAER